MNTLPLCARVGVLHGLITGFLFGVYRLESGFPPLPPDVIAWTVLLLALFGVLVSLFILVVVQRYVLSAVMWQTLVNALLVSLLIVLVVGRIPATAFFLLLSFWIGIIIGLLVGLLLCRLCLERGLTVAATGRRHG
jgi:hypothetical protein